MTVKRNIAGREIPPFLVDASIREVLQAEANSRTPPCSFTRIIREAITEYILNHKLAEKFGGEEKYGVG